ncbi:MAG: acyltransferase family protein [Saccharofermentans sp.]|nr:acyltransferase family protein [Saccharofermentans sp.]
MRKHYLDNLRWIFVLVLIPYHAAQAWNTWGEPNYIFFEGSRVIASVIVSFSPYYMPLLFLIAGISSKFALDKRSYGQFVKERLKRLLVPLLFGVLVFMPVMTWLADRFNYGYEGNLLSHYPVFFTKYTDLIGADGGFSFGQFWFLLYLFVISLISIGIIALQKKIIKKETDDIPFWLILLLGLPLPVLDKFLSIGGKSLALFLYVYLLGYYVFSKDKVIDKLSRFAVLTTSIGVISTAATVYLFLWSPEEHAALNTVTSYISKWFMLLALLGLGKKFLDVRGSVTDYFSRRSFPFFSFHFIFVVVLQYLMAECFAQNTFLLYILPVIVAYILSFICAGICIRIPVLCFLTGMKYVPSDKTKRP